MIRQTDKIDRNRSGSGSHRLLNTVLRALAMLLLLAVVVPLSGYPAKAETEDFLIYVEKVYTITGRGTVISGRVSSGQVNVGDKLTHAGHLTDGSVNNSAVEVKGIEMFKKSLDYAEKGDNIGILLGSYAASRIHVGDALISDSNASGKNFVGPVYGELKNESFGFISDTDRSVTLKKGDLEIRATISGEMSVRANESTACYLVDQDIPHVYSVGEKFDVISSDKKIGTYTVTKVIDSIGNAITSRTDPANAVAVDPSGFRTGPDHPWKVQCIGNKSYAVCGNSDIPSSTSTLTYTFDCSDPVTVFFDYKILHDSGQHVDQSIFYADGRALLQVGANSTSIMSCRLSAGTHTLMWEHKKDANEGPNQDFFGVSELRIISGRKITLNANGGTYPSTQKGTQYAYVHYTGSFKPEENTGIDAPVRAGYKFLGYSSEKGTGRIVRSVTWADAAKPVTIYAVWEKTEYNVIREIPFAEDGKKDEWIYNPFLGSSRGWQRSVDVYGQNIRASYSDTNGLDSVIPLYPHNYIISPALKLGSLKYALRFRAENTEPFEVYCGTEQDFSSMKKLKTIPAGNVKEYSIPLDGYENRTVYVAFLHSNPEGGDGVLDRGVRIADVRLVSEFADVRSAAEQSKDPYYYDPVYWAAEEGITGGVKDSDGVARSFNPQGVCNRAQMVAFLWRMAGCPEPTKYTSYKDVKKSDYYYKAVSWAQEAGITGGYKDGTFRPKNPCTRSQAVSFLYRMAGQPEVVSETNFSDVKSGAYYCKAVLWAQSRGITGGYSDGTFKPDGQCTRAQMVTFLYRYELTK